MNLKYFGARLTAERKRLKISASDICDFVKVHRNSQSGYENGNIEPGISYLAELHKMGFDIAYLVIGDDAMQDARFGGNVVLTTAEKMLILAQRRLPAALRASVAQHILDMDAAMKQMRAESLAKGDDNADLAAQHAVGPAINSDVDHSDK